MCPARCELSMCPGVCAMSIHPAGPVHPSRPEHFTHPVHGSVRWPEQLDSRTLDIQLSTWALYIHLDTQTDGWMDGHPAEQMYFHLDSWTFSCPAFFLPQRPLLKSSNFTPLPHSPVSICPDPSLCPSPRPGSENGGRVWPNPDSKSMESGEWGGAGV